MAGFLLRAASIRPLLSPSEFYHELLSRTLSANKRISLAALYLGTGPMERELAEAVLQRAHEVPGLQVLLQMDHSRSLRRTAKPGEHASTAHLLTDMLRAAPSHAEFQAGLTMMPQLRGLLGQRLLPPRYKEGLGVFHLKAYCFDDTVILSGANLSQDYFTNRQDRYVLFEGMKGQDTAPEPQPHHGQFEQALFASYFHSMLRALHHLPGSHRLTADGKITINRPDERQKRTEGEEWRRHLRAAQDSLALDHHRRQSSQAEQNNSLSSPSSSSSSSFVLPSKAAASSDAARKGKSLLNASAAPQPLQGEQQPQLTSADNDAFARSLRELAKELSCSTSANKKDDQSSSTSDLPSTTASGTALVRPRFQAGPVGVTCDEEATLTLFSQVNPPTPTPAPGTATGDDSSDSSNSESLFLASGYFNLPGRYKQALVHGMKEGTKVLILTASPKANGFYESKGPSQALPTAYSEIERRFYEECRQAQRLDEDPLALSNSARRGGGAGGGGGGISLFEYTRPGWTFHGKGVWWFRAHRGAKALPSMVTLIGSPNYGQRSLSRDLELNLELTTADQGLVKRLKEERDALWGIDKPVNKVDNKNDGDDDGGKKKMVSVTAVGSHLPPALYPAADVWGPKSDRTLRGLFNWRRGYWIQPVAGLIADTL